jgi:Helix-turn-helix domain
MKSIDGGYRMGRPERRLDDLEGPLAAFATQLRDLRRTAGNPSYRTLAQRSHFAASTLSTAAGGDRLPTLDVTLAYVRACGGEEEMWRERWLQVDGLVNRRNEIPINQSTMGARTVMPGLLVAVAAILIWWRRRRTPNN